MALAAANIDETKQDLKAEIAATLAADQPVTPSKKKATPKKKRKKASTGGRKSKKAAHILTMDYPVCDITEAEYANLEELMVHFCRVPLLAEFSRPVTLLHPEVRIVFVVGS